MSTRCNKFERAKVPKDPKLARVFTIEDAASQQYNALVPSDPTGDWEEWYFWIPMPVGTYYAKELLEMALMIMRDNVCVLLEQKLDEYTQFNSGIYWIIDLNEKDWANGLPGIMRKVRGEIQAVVDEDRFPNDERRRLKLEAKSFPDGMKKHEEKEDEEEGVEKERNVPTSPATTASGSVVMFDSNAAVPVSAPVRAPMPAPLHPYQLSRATPIMDPRTVAAGPAYGPAYAAPNATPYATPYAPQSAYYNHPSAGGWNAAPPPYSPGPAMMPQGYAQGTPNAPMENFQRRPHAIPTVVDPRSYSAYAPSRIPPRGQIGGPPNVYPCAPPGLPWGGPSDPRNYLNGRTFIDPRPPANAPRGPRATLLADAQRGARRANDGPYPMPPN